MNQWRRFQFFEERPASSGLSEDLRRSISCSTGGRGAICLGTDEGLVHVADRWLSVRLSFLAHTGPVLAIHQLKQRNILVTVGDEASEDQSSSTTSLKLWDLDRRDEHDSPACARTFDVFSSRFPASKVTTIAALEAPPFNLLIAIGLASGAVDLLRTDSKHISRIRLPSDSTLPQPSSSSSYSSQATALSRLSVTGLGFHSDPDSSAVHLFVVSDGGVSTFPLSNVSTASQPARHLMAPLGAPAKCVTMSNMQDLVVARPEAFYFYNDEGPGPCYALDCEKRAVAWARECLVCVHVDPRKGDRTVLSIYDVRNKLIAHSSVIAGELQHLVCEGPVVVLLVKDGAPLILQEKDTQSKLQALFKKSLYGLALSLVQASKVDVSVMTDVLRKYGDHLFEMRDYDGAVAQYIRTIGQLEPSYVIQKFLSAQRIHNLTHYLESLQQRRAAGPDHTTLLLSCYARLKDVDRLDAFLRATAPAPSLAPALPPVPDTATSPVAAALTATGAREQAGRGEGVQESKGSKQGATEGAKGEASASGTPGAGSSGQGTGGVTGGPGKAGGPAEKGGEGAGKGGGVPERGSGQGEGSGRGESGAQGDSREGRRGGESELTGGPGVAREPHEFPFDAPSAIRICQAAGYEEQALFIAQHAGLHALALGIMFGQLRKFREGLQYLAELPLKDKLFALDRYGPALVAHCPEAVSSLLLDLCTARPPRGAPSVHRPGAHGAEPPHPRKLPGSGGGGRLEADGEEEVPSPVGFAALYVDQPASLVEFLEQFLEWEPESACTGEVLNALLDLYLSLSWESDSQKGSEGKGEREGGSVSAATESGRGGAGGAAEASTSGAPESIPSGKEGRDTAGTPLEGSRDWYLAKAGQLLREGWGQQGGVPQYDPEQAVLSCQMHGFREGLLFLLERMRMYKEVVASYMKENDLKGLIACCKRLGDPLRGGDPSLWADVLVFLGAHEGACEEEVREVLGVVEREALLPPLIVLQALSQNKGITVGVVKDYVARQLAKDTAAIEEDRKAVQRYQEETTRYQAELLELETKAKVFQVQKCTACSTALDLPAVHFLCMHSFHLRCMGDNESECPVCAPANRTVLEMRKSLEQSAHNQDRFFQELHDAKDGFSVIAEYFGRNIMNQSRPASKGGASKGVSHDMLGRFSMQQGT